ncbi:L-ascorbate metabolism protein UlaG (beta-lactamase superfamily) [Stackebrandtia albiflava]|uniref:L-ascorbate metabolism protein UlaG (Beta-lactamase superfamily) n=1 Tax=Stackebrandtia albiflava TaxID=406432 RepID=A0A562V1R5_9ACTN|nr:MBL fold metallo-hydrolase [Stackebrandtia albiflava]TWJ11814.1 L-ascorbate metabolism protein UlaG (beta-lactamase superfamily) [Stackebrandtia albiflava]
MSEPTLEFVGTATTLLRMGPFTLLTDPNFLHRGQRAYLGKGLFSKRRTEPSLRPEGLPGLHGIVLSHLHGDHFDRVARRALDRRLPVFTTPHAYRRLRRWGFGESLGMAPWESTTLTDGLHRLTITSTPGVHSPRPLRALLPPVMGTVLELSGGDAPPFRVYISGDTLYRPWLAQVTERCGPLDAAVVHLGGTRILGVLVTMDDRQGADLVETLHPGVTVPVHYDDYGVFRSALRDFEATWRRRRLPGVLRTVRRGETVRLGRDVSVAAGV